MYQNTYSVWIERHIFPNSKLPSASQVTRSAEGLLLLEHWENLGPDYDTTLMHWHRNFVAAWPELRRRYDERFRRLWRYYLLSCAGAFRARRLQLWQLVLSPEDTCRRYRAPVEWPAGAIVTEPRALRLDGTDDGPPAQMASRAR